MLEHANWISPIRDFGDPCPVFHKSFSALRVRRATLEITGTGIYEAKLNGLPISDYVLAPGWTSYYARHQVQTYDVTRLVTDYNHLEVTLSPGWFHGDMKVMHKETPTDHTTAIIGALTLEFTDGSTAVLPTDESWTVSEGPIRFAGIYGGIVYDARVEDAPIEGVRIIDYPKSQLIPQEGEIIKEHEILPVRSVITTPKGEAVLDFGQEITGYLAFRVNAHAGEEILIHHAEVLDRDGNFYTENYRSAKTRIEYTCREGEQYFKPSHTFFGFRYVRLTKWPGEVDPAAFQAIVVHSDLRRTGFLESDNPMLNRWIENVIWSQKDNFLDVPTDCPQRDERLGWTGDAQVFVKAASYNFDVARFFKKWLGDLAVDQKRDGSVPWIVPNISTPNASAAWGDAATICPWQIYLTYGDTEILERQFDSMKAWVDFITKDTTVPATWTSGKYPHFGDWLGLDAPEGSYKGSSDPTLIASAFYANSTRLVVKAGKVLGKDVAEYEKLLEAILETFHQTYKDRFKTQTEHALALAFGLCQKPEAVAASLAALVEKTGHMTTGFVGTPYLLYGLSRYGRADLAWELMLREDYPSWLFSVKQGATTIWEHIDGIKPDGSFWSADMNSFNHYSFGAAADWLYSEGAGITIMEEFPGFERVRLTPHPTEKLGYLKAKLETRQGLIESGWEKTATGFLYRVTTPVPAILMLQDCETELAPGSYEFEM